MLLWERSLTSKAQMMHNMFIIQFFRHVCLSQFPWNVIFWNILINSTFESVSYFKIMICISTLRDFITFSSKHKLIFIVWHYVTSISHMSVSRLHLISCVQRVKNYMPQHAYYSWMLCWKVIWLWLYAFCWKLMTLCWRLLIFCWRQLILCWHLRILCWRLLVLCWRLLILC